MITELLPAGGLVLCAVSGGADSMYLLSRLGELGYPVAAAHYDHGLRGGASARDAAFVRGWCAGRGIPFLCERGDVASFAAENRLGVEAAARALRYAFLERAADETGAAVVATAHTADDNAETVLLHLTRGSGLRGLGGIPPVRGRIVRPMLDVTRAEVLAYLRDRGIPHVEDETNATDAYARNRVRRRVIPALREENPAFSAAVGRTAALLREDEAFLEGLARSFVEENARADALPVGPLLALPLPVARRAVRRMAGELSFEHTERTLGIARRGGSADLPGLRAEASGGWLRFSSAAAPTVRLPDRPVVPGETTALPEAGFLLRCKKIRAFPADVYKSFNTFVFACEKIQGAVHVTGRRPGDRCRPAGRGCTKTLKALFLERGVPLWERDRVPVLRDEGGVLGVLGFPPAERAAARPGDGELLLVEFIRPEPEREG